LGSLLISFRGAGWFRPRKNTSSAKRNQPSYSIATRTRAMKVAYPRYLALSPSRPRATCPPSSWPTGSRLMAVTRKPTHAAKAVGCRAMFSAMGTSRDSSWYRGWMTMYMAPACPMLPSTACPFAVRNSPINATGMVTASPPRGPAMPMSTRARRLGMGSRMEMNAPNVPNGGMDGMK